VGVKLLVVDDHALVREGIAALLASHDPGTVVLQASDAAEGLELVSNHPDLAAIFLDLAMPGGGMPVIGEFGRRRPDVPVIVLTASDDPIKARQAFDLGALGFVTKSASPQTLLAALQLVLAGEAFVPALLLRGAPEGGARQADGLTPKQTEVLGYLALGLSNKQIARRMGISEKTIKAHVTGVLRCLGAANRADAVALGRERGLV
jgi:two-component system nitrate/nitrite response regulator NarL